MKKRTNMYFDEQDRVLLARIKEHYNLTSDAAAVRLAIKRVAEEIPLRLPERQLDAKQRWQSEQEEIERNVPRPAREHRQDTRAR